MNKVYRSELNSDINKGYVEVIADGVKTYATLLNELGGLIDFTKICSKSKLVEIIGNTKIYYHIAYYDGDFREVRFSEVISLIDFYATSYFVNNSDSKKYTRYNSTGTDYSSTIPTIGTIIRLEY